MSTPLRLHGVPLHPFFVHFPVAAWTVATVLAVIASLQASTDLALLARHLNLFGLISGSIAMLFGFLELPHLPDDTRIRDVAAWHLTAATASWCVYLVMWLLQMKALQLPAALAGMLGLAMLGIAGHLGARLVYHHGFPGQFTPDRDGS